jgi:hypothetical protein
MALMPGTRLGAYDIVALIGTGGMGEKVYHSKDSRGEELRQLERKGIGPLSHREIGVRS